MRQLKPLILLAALVVAAILWSSRTPVPTGNTSLTSTASTRPDTAAALPAHLPPEARDTLERIAHGGPFMHSQDGVVFGNYEGMLPKQSRGYYHEYTVETPGADTRGARRIITGGTPPTVYYYTDDHYRSFHRFEAGQ
jgi:ribonuclease T1